MGHHGDEVGVWAGDGQDEGPGAENHVGEALGQTRQVRRRRAAVQGMLGGAEGSAGRPPPGHPGLAEKFGHLLHKAQGRSYEATKFKETYGEKATVLLL